MVTGDGRDSVSASYNVVLGHFHTRLEELDDALTLVGNQITGFTTGDGGTGMNRLTLIGNQLAGSSFHPFQ
jgi:hypothetical protein